MHDMPRQRHKEYGGSRPAGALMLLLGWLALPLGFLLDVFALALARPGAPTTAWPGVYFQALWRPIAAIVIGLIGFAIILLARRLRRQGKRLLSAITTVAEVLTAPPFVLYLRSFTDDPRLASTRLQAGRSGLYDASDFGSTQSVRTEEEQLRVAVTPFGRMVAVGRPGERLPEVGARRLYLNHDDWQESVLRLMAEAGRTGLVLMGAGLSESLGWEFGQAVRAVPPQRLVLVIALNPLQYEQFRQGAGQAFPRELPHWPQHPTFLRYRAMIRGAIYFDADWTPHFVRFDSLVAPGNAQRVIESKFVYGLRPVYHRLMVKWPGLAWLPRRAAFTRRQIPFVSIVLAVGLLLLVGVVRFLLSVPTYVLPLFGFMLLVSVGSVLLKARSARK